jgi:putative transposon-encoded protein
MDTDKAITFHELIKELLNCEILIRKVRVGFTSGNIYVPKKYMGKTVRILIIPDEDETRDNQGHEVDGVSDTLQA